MEIEKSGSEQGEPDFLYARITVKKTIENRLKKEKNVL